jgi:acetylornithine deacetylase/succinyl-diaminopimelate desuccinylase-like protein
MDFDKTSQFVDGLWESWFVPGLSDFINVPNLTPMVDPEYLTNGKLEQAIDLVDTYINKLNIRGISRKIYKNEKNMPLIVYIIEPEGGSTQNVLMYGHLDKQPYGDGWNADTPPNQATRKGDLLYGRGGGDDGYAPFACALAIKNAQE